MSFFLLQFWEGGKDAQACPLSTHYVEANHVLKPAPNNGIQQPFGAALAHPTMLFLANFFANVDKILKKQTVERMMTIEKPGTYLCLVSKHMFKNTQ